MAYDADVQIKIDADTQNAEASMAQLEKSINKAFKSPSTAVRSMGVQADKLAEKMNKVTTKMNELGNTPIKTDAYKQLENNLARLNAEQDKLNSKIQHMEDSGVSRTSKQYIAAQDALRGYEKEIGETQTKMAQMRKNSETYADWQNKLQQLTVSHDQLNKRIDTMDKRNVNPQSQQYQKALQDLSMYERAIMRVQNKLRQMGAQGFAYSGVGRDTQEYSDLARLLGRLTQQAGIMRQRMSEAGNGVHSLGKRFTSLSQSAGKALKTIGKVGSFLKNHLTGHNVDASKSFKHLLKQVLKYGLGIRSLFLLYKKLRQYGKEAFKDMATQYPEINAQLSDLVAHFSQMTHSIATAFQPLLSVVLPILHTIIDALITAANAVGSFFAALTGQGFIYKAIKQQKNFAGAVGGTGGAAKEAKEELAEYDKLLVIDQDNGAGGGGGGGGGAGGTTFFEKSPLMEGAVNLVEMIKDAWNKSDFKPLGEAFGRKITNALNSINWEPIRATSLKIGTSIAQFLNGAISPDLFGAMGRTIANALNTALDFVYGFVHNFDWKNLGKSLATGVTEFFRTFDFAELGAAIHDFIGGALDAATTFFTETDFKLIGEKIAEFIGNLNIPDLISKLWNLAKAILSALADAIVSLWNNGDVTTRLAMAIVGILAALKFTGLLGGVASSLGGSLAGGLASFFAANPLLITVIATAVIARVLIDKAAEEKLQSAVEKAERTATKNEAERAGLDAFWQTKKAGGSTQDMFGAYLKAAAEATDPKNVYKLLDGYNKLADFFQVDLPASARTGYKAVTESFNGMPSELQKYAKKSYKNITSAFKDSEDWAYGTAAGISNSFNGMPSELEAKFRTAYEKSTDEFKGINQKAKQWSNNTVSGFNGMPSAIEQKYKDAYRNGTAQFNNTKTWAKETSNIAVSGFNGMPSGIQAQFYTAYDSGTKQFNSINTWAKEKSDTAVAGFNGMPSQIQEKFYTAYTNGTKQWNNTKKWSDTTFGTVVDSSNTQMKKIPGIFSDGFKNATAQATNQITGFKSWYDKISFAKKTLEVSVNQGMMSGAQAAIQGLNNYWVDRTATYTVKAEGLEAIQQSVHNIITDLGNAAAAAAKIKINNFHGSIAGIPSNIRGYATGGVFPPNKPFLAMLGDQKSGTNVETPLSTMIQAFNTALDSRGGADSAPIIIQVDGREMARVVWDENEKRYKQTGRHSSRYT